jgi:IS5 family transposase
MHDPNQAKNLLHGDEGFVLAGVGYRGAEKRAELKNQADIVLCPAYNVYHAT